ncbi:Fic/DOC family protein [Thiohalophilus sp.]|uniref:Fic/DOC family protein n=1 Tax=Thiohalophilus sp. TaxID=3028392 RepID=UPI002ACD6EC0|nr:Fic family protein [Thiohalophilus sp.]MDZ7804149.1 Fic family protein [Thiohalophilus sp.]
MPVKDNSDALADKFGASILDPAYCGKTTKRRLMTNKDRYDVSDSIEARFEPGSNESVLKNKLGITDPAEMDRIEAEALIKATDTLFHEYDAEHRFTADDICHMHQLWLGDIYEWAGRYRQINISKDGFAFAMAAQVPKLMAAFETEQLTKYTPCNFTRRQDIVRALAEVHVELVLVHPFREGNGRCARLLASIMALQAGLPVLDFSLLSKMKKADYFAAVQAGMDRNYRPMEDLFVEIIKNSIRA